MQREIQLLLIHLLALIFQSRTFVRADSTVCENFMLTRGVLNEICDHHTRVRNANALNQYTNADNVK